MGEPALRPPTFDELYEQIRQLPQGVTGEILDPGVLRTMSRPGVHHRQTHFGAGMSLRGFNQSYGGTGWWIEIEAEIRFPGDRLIVPDLCGFRVERVPERPLENPIAIVPDWCCEIFSPTTDRVDRNIKLPLFAKSGVPWIWLVDPGRRSIEVYETLPDGRPALTAIAEDGPKAFLPPFGDVDISYWWFPEQPQTP